MCVNERLFHLPKLSKFSKTCFNTTKESALVPFNLAHLVGYSSINDVTDKPVTTSSYKRIYTLQCAYRALQSVQTLTRANL